MPAKSKPVNEKYVEVMLRQFEKPLSAGQRLTKLYYESAGVPTKRTSQAEFNKDAEFMTEVKMMVMKASFRSEKFYSTVMDWARGKANELKLKHSGNETVPCEICGNDVNPDNKYHTGIYTCLCISCFNDEEFN